MLVRGLLKMKKLIVTLFILSTLLFGSCVWAGEFENGVAAYKRKDYVIALKTFSNLASQGDAMAQASLGLIYESGQGVSQDYSEALQWYLLAATQGNAFAQDKLGASYLIGQGVPQDYVESAKWFRLSAAQGDAFGQYNLGVFYTNGAGMPQNYVRAHMWENLAAASGDSHAIKARDTIANLMTPQQIAEAQKMARDCLANNFKNCD